LRAQLVERHRALGLRVAGRRGERALVSLAHHRDVAVTRRELRRGLRAEALARARGLLLRARQLRLRSGARLAMTALGLLARTRQVLALLGVRALEGSAGLVARPRDLRHGRLSSGPLRRELRGVPHVALRER